MRAARDSGTPRAPSSGWLDWLRERRSPRSRGLDTRALVRHIRERGLDARRDLPGASSRGARRRELIAAEPSMGGRDLAREVTPREAFALGRGAGDGPDDRRDRHRRQGSIVANLRARGARLRAAPVHDARAAEMLGDDPDAVFLANGPGDPAALGLHRRRGPRARRPAARSSASASATSCSAAPSACETYKLPFGHRGANHPVKDLDDRAGSRSPARTTASPCSARVARGRSTTIEPVRWETDFGVAELTHINLYDRTVEGLRLPDARREHCPVPPRGRSRARTTRCHLFDRFIARAHALMPRRDDIHRILILGSGPIVIGQAAEFDYSGAQACRVLAEEGYEVDPRQLQPGDDHDRPRVCDSDLHRAAAAGAGRADHRARAPRRAAADARRPDRAEPREGARTRTARSSATASS